MLLCSWSRLIKDSLWFFITTLLSLMLLMSNVVGLYRSWGDVSSPKVISSLK